MCTLRSWSRLPPRCMQTENARWAEKRGQETGGDTVQWHLAWRLPDSSASPVFCGKLGTELNQKLVFSLKS